VLPVSAAGGGLRVGRDAGGDRWGERRGGGDLVGGDGGDDAERQRDRPVLLARGVIGGRVLQRLDTHGQRGSGVFHDGEAAVDADDGVESDGGQRGAGDVGDGHGDDRGGGGATDADRDGDVLPVSAAGGGLRVGRDAGGD